MEMMDLYIIMRMTELLLHITNYYEWHLDIFTDFLAYPKVSLVLSDSQEAMDFIGSVYAVLKP